jgi:hypothetical protein
MSNCLQAIRSAVQLSGLALFARLLVSPDTWPGRLSLVIPRSTQVEKHTHTHTNTLTQQIIPLFSNPGNSVKKENTPAATVQSLPRNKQNSCCTIPVSFVYLFPVKRRILAGKIARANQNGGKISST